MFERQVYSNEKTHLLYHALSSTFMVLQSCRSSTLPSLTLVSLYTCVNIPLTPPTKDYNTTMDHSGLVASTKPTQNPHNKLYLLVFAACSSCCRIAALALLDPPSFGPLGWSFAPGGIAGLRCCRSSIDSKYSVRKRSTISSSVPAKRGLVGASSKYSTAWTGQCWLGKGQSFKRTFCFAHDGLDHLVSSYVVAVSPLGSPSWLAVSA